MFIATEGADMLLILKVKLVAALSVSTSCASKKHEGPACPKALPCAETS